MIVQLMIRVAVMGRNMRAAGLFVKRRMANAR
jgi:hypothetical protein